MHKMCEHMLQEAEWGIEIPYGRKTVRFQKLAVNQSQRTSPVPLSMSWWGRALLQLQTARLPLCGFPSAQLRSVNLALDKEKQRSAKLQAELAVAARGGSGPAAAAGGGAARSASGLDPEVGGRGDGSRPGGPWAPLGSRRIRSICTVLVRPRPRGASRVSFPLLTEHQAPDYPSRMAIRVHPSHTVPTHAHMQAVEDVARGTVEAAGTTGSTPSILHALSFPHMCRLLKTWLGG